MNQMDYDDDLLDEITQEEIYSLNSKQKLIIKLEEINNNIQELRKQLSVEIMD